MKKITIYICFLFAVFNANAVVKTIILPTIPNRTFNVIDYGASTVLTDNTLQIQNAINACSTAGGGTVNIPAGTFLCGPLNLKANVNLYISAGAILKMLPYGTGNGIPEGSYPNNGTIDDYNPLISGNKVNNIKVSGSGSIDGQGLDWWTKYRSCKCIGRPGVIRFDNCNYVQIDSITIINAPNVHITVGKTCTNSTISNVIINSPSDSPNTDGIDTWSPYVDILNCNINCGDDNIAMDSNSSYITVKNCIFGTGHGCSIGSYASNIRNVLVDSCVFNGTGNGARFKTSRDRGGIEEYITYSNCVMNNVSNPFFLSSYYPKEPAIPDTASSAAITSSTPTWRHITFKNIVVNNATYAGIIWGLPELSITDVVFDNVKITANTAMKAYNVKDLIFKNNSSITVPVSAKINGKVIDLYNANSSGLDLFTGQPYVESTQKIYLNSNDDIGSTLISSYNGTSTKVEIIFPTDYINPSANTAVDLTSISSLIKDISLIGNDNLPVVKTLQFNLPSTFALNSFNLKKLTLMGVDNGSSVTSTYLFYPNTSGITVGSFNVDSCVVKNYYGVIRVANIGTNGSISAINFNHCLVSNLGGYGFITLGNSSYSFNGDINITNSTFTNVQASLFYAKYTSSVNVNVSDCTFDNILGASSSYLFYGNSSSIFKMDKCILGKTLNVSSGGILSSIVNANNSYKTSDWVNGSNSTSQFIVYNDNSANLFKTVALYDINNLTNSTFGDYTIKDSLFQGKTSAGDPRWYYTITTQLADTLKTKEYKVHNGIIEFPTPSSFEIYNLNGQKIAMAEGVRNYSLKDLPYNLYILKIYNPCIITVKFIYSN